jgi:dolichol-phosphate mannosyltransferase
VPLPPPDLDSSGFLPSDLAAAHAPAEPHGRAVVIVPTYNEAENIAVVLDRVLEQPGHLDVLIVDDGSPDGTANLVRASQRAHPGRIHLMERSGKLGLGTAYLAGFRWALETGYTYVLEMDADLSHNPADLPSLLAPVAADDADLAIGSRYLGGVRVMNWPLTRLMLSYGAGMYTRAITNLPVQDVTAGFKCFHRRVLEAIDLDSVRSNGYSFQVEMNYRAWRKGFRIQEVPIVFTERTEGQSKMSKGIVREAALKVWELRFRAVLGRL